MEKKIQEQVLGRDLNLSAVARRAGIPKTTVHGWKERGVCSMSLLHFAKWAGAREMTGDEVMRLLRDIRRAIG